MTMAMLGRVSAGVLTLLFAVSCGDSSATAPAADASATLVQPPCPAYRPVDQEPFALARRVVDATQSWDVAALCGLVGVSRVPSGLVEYHAALENGLPDGLELVAKKIDDETAMFDFDIPAAGGREHLRLAFHRQGGGWALVTASYRGR